MSTVRYREKAVSSLTLIFIIFSLFGFTSSFAAEEKNAEHPPVIAHPAKHTVGKMGENHQGKSAHPVKSKTVHTAAVTTHKPNKSTAHTNKKAVASTKSKSATLVADNSSHATTIKDKQNLIQTANNEIAAPLSRPSFYARFKTKIAALVGAKKADEASVKPTPVIVVAENSHKTSPSTDKPLNPIVAHTEKQPALVTQTAHKSSFNETLKTKVATLVGAKKIPDIAKPAHVAENAHPKAALPVEKKITPVALNEDKHTLVIPDHTADKAETVESKPSFFASFKTKFASLMGSKKATEETAKPAPIVVAEDTHKTFSFPAEKAVTPPATVEKHKPTAPAHTAGKHVAAPPHKFAEVHKPSPVVTAHKPAEVSAHKPTDTALRAALTANFPAHHLAVKTGIKHLAQNNNDDVTTTTVPLNNERTEVSSPTIGEPVVNTPVDTQVTAVPVTPQPTEVVVQPTTVTAPAPVTQPVTTTTATQPTTVQTTVTNTVAPAPQPVVQTTSQPVTTTHTATTLTPATPVQIQKLETNIIPHNNRISFRFQNIDIRTLIQLIAKVSGKNFIISDAVKGVTTINLTDVTWQQALQTILKSNGLASKRYGDTIIISTVDDLAQKEAKELQSAADIANLMPLSSAMITLKYTDAGNIVKMVKSPDSTLLTPRGEIAVDLPTNTVIVRDIRTNLRDIVRFIRKLDKPARQVEIEARIVTIDSNYEAQLGVRFGLSNTRSLSGTLSGANQLANGISPAAIDPLHDRLNFDIPANLLTTGASPASIGLALARLGPVLLDLELSALEEEGHSQIISRPRVVTANQQKALIQTGEEIPYQQATSSGATSVDFKKAVLSLEIIPQITPDDKILLKLKATQDTRGPQLLVNNSQTTTTGITTTTIPATFGPPTINTQEVQSYVLLNNNETVVIGGIYKLSKSNTLDRVPFISNLPIIGGLFKHRGIKNQRTELLFFVTPRIIKPRQQYAEYKAGEG